MLRTLLRHGCDVDLVAHHYMSPLHIAAWHGHKELVNILVQDGRLGKY